jgi:hypothetical protein
MLEKEEAKKSKAKEKQKESRPPPPPRLSPAHRGTPPLEVYVAHESATASSIRCKTSGPSTSTGIPDQPAGVSNANLNQQQAEGQDADMVQVCFCRFLPLPFYLGTLPSHLITLLPIYHTPIASPALTPIASAQDEPNRQRRSARGRGIAWPG